MAMETEERNREEIRELRLEGVGLMFVGAVLLVLLVASFYLGRWYERQTGSPVPAGMAAEGMHDALANVVESEPAADVDGKSDFFDEAAGRQKELEPGREIAKPQQAAESPAAERPASSGSFYVQVVAGRDRGSIENLIEELKAKGYSARLFSEREGGGTLFKVRVGGFSERGAADEAAEKLRQDGYSGAWVTTVE
jgi:cell division septation protein DedD